MSDDQLANGAARVHSDLQSKSQSELLKILQDVEIESEQLRQSNQSLQLQEVKLLHQKKVLLLKLESEQHRENVLHMHKAMQAEAVCDQMRQHNLDKKTEQSLNNYRHHLNQSRLIQLEQITQSQRKSFVMLHQMLNRWQELANGTNPLSPNHGKLNAAQVERVDAMFAKPREQLKKDQQKLEALPDLINAAVQEHFAESLNRQILISFGQTVIASQKSHKFMQLFAELCADDADPGQKAQLIDEIKRTQMSSSEQILFETFFKPKVQESTSAPAPVQVQPSPKVTFEMDQHELNFVAEDKEKNYRPFPAASSLGFFDELTTNQGSRNSNSLKFEAFDFGNRQESKRDFFFSQSSDNESESFF